MFNQLYSLLSNPMNPRKILNADDARNRARRRIPRIIFDFIDGSTGSELTPNRNIEAFKSINLQPRALKNVSKRKLNTTILNEKFSLPFGFAPMGMSGLSVPNADNFMAKISIEKNIPIGVSTAASSSLEDMRNKAGEHAWFQLYSASSLEETLPFVDRARVAGYKKLILTVDVPQVSKRIRDIRNGFAMPFKIGPAQFIDFACHPFWSVPMLLNGIPFPENFRINGEKKFQRDADRSAADWGFLKKLRDVWKDDLIIKGITHHEDAIKIKKIGCDAIWVSNHGGRQLDSCPSAISRLPIIREALGKDYPLLFDSGIRTGDDVIKALALGANFVMIGRPILFALGAGGQNGLNSYVSALSQEVSTVMAQLGLNSIREINRDCIAQ